MLQPPVLQIADEPAALARMPTLLGGNDGGDLVRRWASDPVQVRRDCRQLAQYVTLWAACLALLSVGSKPAIWVFFHLTYLTAGRTGLIIGQRLWWAWLIALLLVKTWASLCASLRVAAVQQLKRPENILCDSSGIAFSSLVARKGMALRWEEVIGMKVSSHKRLPRISGMITLFTEDGKSYRLGQCPIAMPENWLQELSDTVRRSAGLQPALVSARRSHTQIFLKPGWRWTASGATAGKVIPARTAAQALTSGQSDR